jgi:hypothetical protein
VTKKLFIRNCGRTFKGSLKNLSFCENVYNQKNTSVSLRQDNPLASLKIGLDCINYSVTKKIDFKIQKN